MTVATLVAGGNSRQREAAIVAAIRASVDPDASTALILEGLPDGATSIDPVLCLSVVQVIRLAPGCPCCIGNLVMRVTLNRILRRPPARLYIGLAATGHLEQVRQFLKQPPYDDLLSPGADLVIQDNPTNADTIIRAVVPRQ